MKKLVFIIVLLILLLSCTTTRKNTEKTSDVQKKVVHYEDIRVNSNFEIEGVNRLDEVDENTKGNYVFTYVGNKLIKINSNTHLTRSYFELSKYIFGVNKEWNRLYVDYTNKSRSYRFFYNDTELIKFIVNKSNDDLVSTFEVIPFQINYDSFNILSKGKYYSGKVLYNDSKLVSKIEWDNSDASFDYQYNKSILTKKTINENKNVLFEYNYDYDGTKIIKKVK